MEISTLNVVAGVSSIIVLLVPVFYKRVKNLLQKRGHEKQMAVFLSSNMKDMKEFRKYLEATKYKKDANFIKLVKLAKAIHKNPQEHPVTISYELEEDEIIFLQHLARNKSMYYGGGYIQPEGSLTRSTRINSKLNIQANAQKWVDSTFEFVLVVKYVLPQRYREEFEGDVREIYAVEKKENLFKAIIAVLLHGLGMFWVAICVKYREYFETEQPKVSDNED